MRFLAIAVAAILAAQSAPAQERSFVLLADERLEASGLLSFLVPRFALKHRIRPRIVTGVPGGLAALEGRADVILAGPDDSAGDPVFYRTGADPAEAYAVALVPGGAGSDHAAVFLDWLTGDVGRATVETFAPGGTPLYRPGAPGGVVVEEVVIEGDANAGERLALLHCGRCHVVGPKNRMGGIGSTPSFGALRAIPGWEDKFQAFWSANPHPSFTQVEGLTEPFDPANPPHIAPVRITIEDIDAILAYAASVAPKDLGAPISTR